MLEHAERFSRMEADKARKTVKELAKGKITEEMAVKIVDVMPATVASLRAIISKDKVELTDEEAAHILKELA